ncbi:MAG: hypothetical protein EU551_00440 [Promethearchaeota archaeon]|nr:MAG: hypothetical protein EU551_00440 [Candidatus Lokiarchaeota archaeon]
MISFLDVEKLRNNFQNTVDIVFKKLQLESIEDIGNTKVGINLGEISFLMVFYLFLLNFKNIEVITSIFKNNSNSVYKLNKSELLEKVGWDDLKEVIRIISSFSGFENDGKMGLPFHNFISKFLNGINFDDKILAELKSGIYFGDSDIKDPSFDKHENFNVGDAFLLGKFYEDFLKRDILNDKSNVKRKMRGKYYTPKNLASYVIEKSFSEYFKTRNISKIQSIQDILKLKILDPSMGTGNFIFEVLEYLLNRIKQLDNSIDLSHLRNQIIKECIYGVDIDPIAIEVARWGLYLYANAGLNIFKTIKNKIKIGNSLFTKSWKSKSSITNCFLWELEFPEVFKNKDSGKDFGFDIIIGNPPHVENKKINPEDKKFLKSHPNLYRTPNRLYDYTIPFIELSIRLLKNNGILGYVTANKFLSADYGYDLRALLLEKTELLYLIDISTSGIFKTALSYPIILIFRKNKEKKEHNSVRIGTFKGDTDPTKDIKGNIEGNIGFEIINQDSLEKIPNKIFPLKATIKKLLTIFEKKNTVLLEDLVDFKYRPLKFTNWGIFLDYIHDKNNHKGEKGLKFIGCGNIDQFGIHWNKRIRLLRTNFKRAYLFKPQNIPDEKWEIMETPKILIREIALKLTAAYDNLGEYSNLTGLYILYNFKISPDYLLAILNSEILDECYNILFGSVHLQGGYLNYHASYLKVLPILQIIPQCDKKFDYTINNEIEKFKPLLKEISAKKMVSNEIKEIISHSDQSKIYFLIIACSRKLQEIMRSKLEITNSFWLYIEKKLDINIENLKYKGKLLKFFKYNWNEILNVLNSNKDLFNIDKSELKEILPEIKEKYSELKDNYKSLMDIQKNIKTNLDKIIEYFYLH